MQKLGEKKKYYENKREISYSKLQSNEGSQTDNGYPRMQLRPH